MFRALGDGRLFATGGPSVVPSFYFNSHMDKIISISKLEFYKSKFSKADEWMNRKPNKYLRGSTTM